MEYVYEIIIGETRRYVGRTNNIKRRQTEHRRGFRNDTKKLLYTELKKIDEDWEIELNIIKEFSKKVDAKRWECLLILQDYFGEKELWQKVPRIGD